MCVTSSMPPAPSAMTRGCRYIRRCQPRQSAVEVVGNPPRTWRDGRDGRETGCQGAIPRPLPHVAVAQRQWRRARSSHGSKVSASLCQTGGPAWAGRARSDDGGHGSRRRATAKNPLSRLCACIPSTWRGESGHISAPGSVLQPHTVHSPRLTSCRPPPRKNVFCRNERTKQDGDVRDG